MLRLVVARSVLRQTAAHSRAFASASSRVKILGSDSAYTQIATEGSGGKAIVYFTAKWCPPCKMISPIYDELSAKYPDIEFAKVDVDELNDTTAKAGVRVRCLVLYDAQDAAVYSMPTFFAFNDGKLQRGLSVQQFVYSLLFSGADEALLRDNIKQLNEL
ncbi:Zz-type zinc finger-containing protein, partial [Globisporangium splendens]